MASISLNYEERKNLTKELEIANGVFQKNINILKKVYQETEQIFKEFKSFIDKEQANITTTLSSESYQSLVSKILSMPSPNDLDYDIAIAKSIIEMGDDISFTNKYIDENDISKWMLEIKKVLDHKFIFRLPPNPNSYFVKPKEFKLENEEVKLPHVPPPKEFNEKNLDLAKFKIEIEGKLYENRIDEIYYNKSKELCIGIITNEEMIKNLGKHSINNIMHTCNDCKSSKASNSMILLKCGCKFCLNCFKKYILINYFNTGFKTFSDSNEKDKLYSICYCIEHKSIIPLNLLTKIFSFKELDFLQYKSLVKLNKEIYSKKIILDQKLVKFCSLCCKLSDPEHSYIICKNNHNCCQLCLSKISHLFMSNNKTEKCKFKECDNLIEVRKQMPKSYYSHI